MLIWLKNQGKVRYRTFQLRSGRLADLPSCMPTGTPMMTMNALVTWLSFSLKTSTSAEELGPEVVSSVASLVGRGERPAPGRAELLAKRGRIVGGVGCPPNCRTSGKLRGNFGETSGKLRGNFGEARGSSDPFELFRKMLHFGKIPKKFGQI